MPDIIGSTVTSKYSLELAAMLGAFLSLAHRGLKPIGSLIAFFGGSIVALIFGQPAASYFAVTQDWIIPFGFFLGSTAWSVFGGVLRLFERFREDPVGTVKNVKELAE